MLASLTVAPPPPSVHRRLASSRSSNAVLLWPVVAAAERLLISPEDGAEVLFWAGFEAPDELQRGCMGCRMQQAVGHGTLA